MSAERKQLFNDWMSLKYQIQETAAVIQNPIENLTTNDRERFMNQACALKKELDRLIDSTRDLLR